MAFPTSPSNGQIYNNYRYDSSKGAWVKIVTSVLSGVDTFHNSAGEKKTVTHNYGQSGYSVTIVPSSDANGYLGEWYITDVTNNSFGVVKTGSAENVSFKWTIQKD